MPRVTLNIPDHIYAAAQARGLKVEDYMVELLRAAVISFGNEEEMMTQEIPQAATVKRGRPATGLTREKRTINLEPRVWAWLEAQATPGESFSETCNRVIGSFIDQVSPAKKG